MTSARTVVTYRRRELSRSTERGAADHDCHPREPPAGGRPADRRPRDLARRPRRAAGTGEGAHPRGRCNRRGPPSTPDDGGRPVHHRGRPGRAPQPARPLRRPRGTDGVPAHVVPGRTVREPVRGLHHDLLGYAEPLGVPERAWRLVRRVRTGAVRRARGVHRVHGVPPPLVLHGRRRRRPRPRRPVRCLDVLAAPGRPGFPHQHGGRPGLGGFDDGAGPARPHGHGAASRPGRSPQRAGRRASSQAGSGGAHDGVGNNWTGGRPTAQWTRPGATPVPASSEHHH